MKFANDQTLSRDGRSQAPKGIRLVRAALLEILDSACFLVDTAEGRLSGGPSAPGRRHR